MEVKRTRKIVFAAVTGIITGFQYAAGSRLDRQDTLDLRDASFYLSWLVISVAAASIVYVIWWFANRLWTDRMTSGRKEENRSHGGVEFTPLFLHLFYTGVLLLCWLPALLSIVPGVFSYDAYAEWEQVKTGLITSHHPVLHVLLVGACWKVSTGSRAVTMWGFVSIRCFRCSWWPMSWLSPSLL